MNVAEFVPLTLFRRWAARFWLAALLAAAGGLAGFLFHRLQPPLYEAKSELVIGIDFAVTGPISEINQDLAINAAGSLLYSQPVMERLLEAGARSGVPGEELVYGQDLFRERRFENWELRVRNADPRLAAELANAWAEYGLEAIEEAFRNALRSKLLASYVTGLQTCLPPPNDDLTDLCRMASLADVRREIEAVQGEIEQTAVASAGVTPGLRFGLASPAEVPAEPVIYNRNWLVLAGALIGFTLSLLWITLRPTN